jgi:muconolactone D-isomerase
MLFLIKMRVSFPDHFSDDDRSALRAQEAQVAKELAQAGTLIRLWKTDANTATWGIWQADDQRKVEVAIQSLPLHAYMEVEIHQLTEHPNDPKGPEMRVPA